MTGRIIRPDAEPGRVVLPRIGQIKIGMKNDRGLPQSVDYFIASGKYSGLFNQAFGEKPNTIQVMFTDDDPANVCVQEYQYRDDDGRLIASGDGETFKCWNGKMYVDYSVSQYPKLMAGIAEKHPNKLVKAGGDGWSIVLSLNFIIPLVRGVVGVWQFTTKGNASTIPSIIGAFDGVREMRGYVKGVIFDLSVSFATSQKPGSKSRFPVVTLVANESVENLTKIKEAFTPVKLLE